MRKACFCVAVAAGAWLLTPAIQAGAPAGTARFGQEQWRIFPHSPFRRAADIEITSRFTRQIEPLVQFFQGDGTEGRVEGRTETVAESLLDAKARTQFFRLESLLRLYVRAFPDLERYLVSVKGIEDGIGAYSYAVDSLKFAENEFKKDARNGPSDRARTAEQEKALSGLQKKEAAARVVFEKLVEQSTIASDLPELRTQVAASLAGWRPGQDLEYVDGELQRTLKDAKDGRYDFNKLEDGIHEYRRRLRWFPMMIDSLDGLVLLRDDAPGSCPVPSLEALAGTRAATHRYSNPALTYPAAHPCTISRCLLWPVVKSIDELGRLKDVAEGNAALEEASDFDYDAASSNKVTPEETARAKQIRAELLSSRALDALIGQLASCRP